MENVVTAPEVPVPPVPRFLADYEMAKVPPRPSSEELATAQAVLARGCSRPAVVRHPTYGRVLSRCGSRLKEQCESCSAMSVGDWSAIVRSGIFDEDGTPNHDDSLFFLTLTAPSFGKVHWVPDPEGGKKKARRRPCSCGEWHDAVRDAGLRGIPVDPTAYAYYSQVRWNTMASDLWDSTRALLRANFPGIEYALVWEMQARGVRHAHVLLRLPRHLGATAADIRRVAGSATTRDDFYREEERTTWGEQVDVREVRPDGETAKLVWYCGKLVGYTLKSISDGSNGTRDSRADAHFDRLDAAARSLPCGPDCNLDKCSRSLHSKWGAKSHVVSVSRGRTVVDANGETRKVGGWSLSGLTRKKQREARLAHWLAKNKRNKKTEHELAVESLGAVRAYELASAMVQAEETWARAESAGIDLGPEYRRERVLMKDDETGALRYANKVESTLWRLKIVKEGLEEAYGASSVASIARYKAAVYAAVSPEPA